MRISKRLAIALGAAALAFSAVFAMAASLGGITSTNVGADNTAVASCDSDGVSTSYTTAWDATDGRYEITSVTVGGVSDTCDGQTMAVTLTNLAGAQIGTGTLAIPTNAATSHAVSLTTHPSAKDTVNVHVVISS